ncbi:MAG: hypothetical protein EOP11_11015, partial [Proteobacteria bacterium]
MALLSTLNNLPIVVFRCQCVKNDARFESLSAYAETLFGQEARAFIAQFTSFLSHFPRGERESFLAALAACPVAHGNFTWRGRILTNAGVEKHVEISGVSFPGAEDSFYLDGMISDITAQHIEQTEREQESALLADILSHIPHSVFWKDKNSVYR